MKFLSSYISQSIQPPKRSPALGEVPGSGQADIENDHISQQHNNHDAKPYEKSAMMESDQLSQLVPDKAEEKVVDSHLGMPEHPIPDDGALRVPASNLRTGRYTGDQLSLEGITESVSDDSYAVDQQSQSVSSPTQAGSDLVDKNNLAGSSVDELGVGVPKADKTNIQPGLDENDVASTEAEISPDHKRKSANSPDLQSHTGIHNDAVMEVSHGHENSYSDQLNHEVKENELNESWDASAKKTDSEETSTQETISVKNKVETEIKLDTSVASLEVNSPVNEFIRNSEPVKSRQQIETQSASPGIPQVRIGQVNVVIDDQSSKKAIRKSAKPVAKHSNSFGLRGL